MNNTFKPDGYNSLSPYFVVEEAQKWVDLLQKVLGAIVLRRYLRPDGSIMHLELRIDDTVIMMGGSTKEYVPNQQMIHLYVPNVEQTYRAALENGCEPVQEPLSKEDDEDKRGAFKDFAGNVWWVATKV